MTNKPQQKEPQKQEEQSAETVPKEDHLRLAADFENYRRSMDQQMTEMTKFAGASVVVQLLDMMDHFEQALAHTPDAVRAQAEWFQGLEQVKKEFDQTLAKFYVQRIPTVGEPFDPHAMEALSIVAGGEAQTVKEEVRAGYRMHDRIIRPARVIIYQ